MSDQPNGDIRTLVADIEARVARRRAAGEYPEELLERLHEDFAVDDTAEPPEVLCVVESSRPLRSDHPAIGRAVVLGKKVMRRLLAWYVAPIAADQTRFNVALLRDVRRIERRLGRLETNWQTSVVADRVAVTARASAINTLLGELPEGDILAAADDDELIEVLRAKRVGVVGVVRTGRDGRRMSPLDALEDVAPASVAAVVIGGLLPRMTATELVDSVNAAAVALRPGGVLVVDAPDVRRVAPGTPPDTQDVRIRRWLQADTFQVLSQAAGLQAGDPIDVGTPASWFAVGAKYIPE